MVYLKVLVLQSMVNFSFASYAPVVTTCPTGVELVRPPKGLSSEEVEWVHGRKAVAAKLFAAYLNRLDLEDFDTATYVSKITNNSDENMPVISFALSGGAWRSAYTGTGAIRALDDTITASIDSKTGGLLQSMTYLAGLSGGSWPVSSYASHNFPSFDDMINTWKVNFSAYTNDDFELYFEQIAPKFEAGFNISAADVLGRAYAYSFLPPPNGSLEMTWSSIAELSNFKNSLAPMPMLQASSLNADDPSAYGVLGPRPNNTIYTWTPFEFGSFDVGSTPTKYVGSLLNDNGNAGNCVEGLDRTSFVMSSAAAAWNYWWLEAVSNNTLGSFSKRSVAQANPIHRHLNRRSDSSLFPIDTLEALNDQFNETFGLSLSQIANPSIPAAFLPTQNITLADNSEALQALPLWSLIQPARSPDFIMAWDDDPDAFPYKWINGTNMYDTSVLAAKAGLPFPLAPPPSTFLARNYTLRPTFFGCNASLTTTGDSRSPIVLYMANSPYSWYSNFSGVAFTMSYEEFDGLLENSFNIVTQANSTLDSEWPACIACAAVERSLERVGMEKSNQCERCFAKYCWDGTVDAPDAPVGDCEDGILDPGLRLDPSYGFLEWNETHPFTG